MSLAETAELIARLSLKDQLTGPLKGATAQLGAAAGQVSRSQTVLGGLSRVTSGVGNAFHHAAGRVGSLTKVLGFGGLLGGAVAVTGFFKSAINDARAFGNAAEDMASTLNISRSEAQLFIGTFKQFGIEGDQAQKIVGMLLKNVGNLSLAAGGAKGFMDKFGFSITDASGKVKDANTIIEDFTDYWNNETIPAEQKVAAGAALFGRSWQGMLEVLQSGKGAWRDATQLAKDLGLANDDLTEQAEKNEQAMFRWNAVLGALKITIGAEVLPILTDLAEQATRFVRDNRSDITHFFRNLRNTAKEAVTFITGTVLPMIGDLSSKANSFWSSIPAPLRDLLTKGFVADRTIKFLFGFSVTDVAKGALSGLADIVAKQFFMRGSSPANPLFVVDIAGGKPGGIVPGAAGGLGAATLLGGGSAIAASIIAVVDQVERLPRLLQGIQEAGAARTASEVKSALTSLFAGTTVLQPWQAFLPDLMRIAGLGGVPEAPMTLTNPMNRGGSLRQAAADSRVVDGLDKVDSSVQDVEKAQGRSAASIAKGVQDSTGRLGTKFTAEWSRISNELRDQGATHREIRRGIISGLGISSGKLDRLVTVMRGEVARELGLTVSELRQIKRSSNHNEQAIADKLGISIEELRGIRDRARVTASQVTGINKKDFSPTVNLKVVTTVTNRDLARTSIIGGRYGKIAV